MRIVYLLKLWMGAVGFVQKLDGIFGHGLAEHVDLLPHNSVDHLPSGLQVHAGVQKDRPYQRLKHVS